MRFGKFIHNVHLACLYRSITFFFFALQKCNSWYISISRPATVLDLNERFSVLILSGYSFVCSVSHLSFNTNN